MRPGLLPGWLVIANTVIPLLTVMPALWADSNRVPLRLAPDSEAPVLTLLVETLPFEIMEVSDTWWKVRQVDTVGWIEPSSVRLPGAEQAVILRGNSRIEETSPAWRYTLAGHSGIERLFRFALDDREQREKMSHPFFRHRIPQISKDFGPLFYLRTHHYYVKGICFAGLAGGRVRVSLVKRRIFYRQIFGSLWSDEFMRAAVESNRGWLGNREVFGNGREYFIELSWHF